MRTVLKIIISIFGFLILLAPMLIIESLIFIFGGWTLEEYERPSPLRWYYDEFLRD